MRAIPDLPVSNPAGFVLHVLTDGVLTHDVTGRIVQWNQAAPRILGIADDALGASSTNPFWNAVHADGSPWPIETQPAQLTLYQGIQVHDETMGIPRPDGTFTWLRVNAYPTHDDEGVVDGATTIFNDITDLYEQAASQQANRRRFARIPPAGQRGPRHGHDDQRGDKRRSPPANGCGPWAGHLRSVFYCTDDSGRRSDILS